MRAVASELSLHVGMQLEVASNSRPLGGSGSPGHLRAQGPHRSGRAGLPHPALQECRFAYGRGRGGANEATAVGSG